MKFSRPTRKRSEVPIVPLIDILFTLLIFFVVTTNFKKPRHTLQIELPVVKNLPSQTISESRAVLAMDQSGKLALEGLKIPDGLLKEYINAFLKQNPNGKLELEVDKNTPLEKLLNIWQELTDAGIPIKDVPARILEPAKH